VKHQFYPVDEKDAGPCQESYKFKKTISLPGIDILDGRTVIWRLGRPIKLSHAQSFLTND
jgi:hypothetical protein